MRVRVKHPKIREARKLIRAYRKGDDRAAVKADRLLRSIRKPHGEHAASYIITLLMFVRAGIHRARVG